MSSRTGEYYHWYRDHGICTVCRRNRPERGYVVCGECREFIRLRYSANTIAEAKAKRDAWRAEGKCTGCGGEREDAEFMMCRGCRAYKMASVRRNKEGARRWKR